MGKPKTECAHKLRLSTWPLEPDDLVLNADELDARCLLARTCPHLYNEDNSSTFSIELL